MSDKPTHEYCLCSMDGEKWLAGPFATITEAREESKRWDESCMSIHEVRIMGPADFIPSPDDLCETADQSAFDNGFQTDDAVFMVPRELQAEAREALEAWANKYIEVQVERFAGELVERLPTPEAP